MECECKITQILSRHPRRREALIPILQDLQGRFGYLPTHTMEAAARFCRVYPVEVYGAATFYSQFKLKPAGKKTVMVCQGTACHVMGGAKVLDVIKKQLNVEPGDTTEDGMFTLETVACIGACALAPTMVVDGNTVGMVKTKEIPEVLDAARNE